MTATKRQEEAVEIGARYIAMSYLTATVGNGYLERAVEELRRAGLFKHDLKRRINLAVSYFDNFIGSIKWVFQAAGDGDVNKQIIDDYEVLQEACDHFMRADVRLTAKQAWNSDDIRQEDIYMCYVDGAADTDTMLLRWANRQWLMYVPSAYGGGWMQLLPNIKVMEVVSRVAHYKRTTSALQNC